MADFPKNNLSASLLAALFLLAGLVAGVATQAWWLAAVALLVGGTGLGAGLAFVARDCEQYLDDRINEVQLALLNGRREVEDMRQSWSSFYRAGSPGIFGQRAARLYAELDQAGDVYSEGLDQLEEYDAAYHPEFVAGTAGAAGYTQLPPLFRAWQFNRGLRPLLNTARRTAGQHLEEARSIVRELNGLPGQTAARNRRLLEISQETLRNLEELTRQGVGGPDLDRFRQAVEQRRAGLEKLSGRLPSQTEEAMASTDAQAEIVQAIQHTSQEEPAAQAALNQVREWQAARQQLLDFADLKTEVDHSFDRFQQTAGNYPAAQPLLAELVPLHAGYGQGHKIMQEQGLSVENLPGLARLAAELRDKARAFSDNLKKAGERYAAETAELKADLEKRVTMLRSRVNLSAEPAMQAALQLLEDLAANKSPAGGWPGVANPDNPALRLAGPSEELLASLEKVAVLTRTSDRLESELEEPLVTLLAQVQQASASLETAYNQIAGLKLLPGMPPRLSEGKARLTQRRNEILKDLERLQAEGTTLAIASAGLAKAGEACREVALEAGHLAELISYEVRLDELRNRYEQQLAELREQLRQSEAHRHSEARDLQRQHQREIMALQQQLEEQAGRRNPLHL